MNILNSNSNTEILNDNLISFKDCPYGCVDGKIVDPYKHKRVICPYCAEKRKKFVSDNLKDKNSNKSISELLDLPSTFTGVEFDESIVIPEFARKNISTDSLNNVLGKLRELVTDISIGNLPSCSLLFNLGKKANEINFIYPYLIKGYLSGRSLVPLVTLTDLCQLRLAFEGSSYSLSIEKNYNYNDLINRDICVVVIDAGATYTSILAVKGLMQLRAQKLKPTIIFTNQWNNYIRDLCSEDDYTCYNLATLYTVEYLDKECTKSSNVDQISPSKYSTGFGISNESFNNLLKPKNSL